MTCDPSPVRDASTVVDSNLCMFVMFNNLFALIVVAYASYCTIADSDMEHNLCSNKNSLCLLIVVVLLYMCLSLRYFLFSCSDANI